MALLAVNGQPLINPNQWKDLNQEQMAYINAMYEIYVSLLEESDLFPDGLPEMNYSFSKKIKLKE